MFGISQFRLYAYAAIALAIAFLVAREHWAVQARKAAQAHAAQLETALETERKNRQIEQDDRRRADEATKSLQTQLDSISAVRPVRVLCRTPSLPSAASQSGSSAGTADSSGDQGAGGPVSDYGPAIEAVRIEAQRNNARHEALIQWEQNRSH